MKNINFLKFNPKFEKFNPFGRCGPFCTTVVWVRAVPSELGGGAACTETVNKLRSSVATPGLASLRQPSVELSLYKVRDTSSARPRVGPLDETPCPLDGPRVAALPPKC